MLESAIFKPNWLFVFLLAGDLACASREADAPSFASSTTERAVCVGRPDCPPPSNDAALLRRRRFVDLAFNPADGTLLGRSANRGLGGVAIGDVSGDAAPEVCAGSIDSIELPNAAERTTAGRVSCYPGAALISGLEAVAPEGAVLDVLGASPQDRLGGSGSGRVIIADVTGDGRADMILSAPLGDGPEESRTNAGEIYVLTGGHAALTGTVDLAAPPSGLVATTIYGRAPEDRLRLLGVGDMTGDGVLDLIAGSPGGDMNGERSGRVYVLAGGPSLAAGAIDLASTAAYAELSGPPGDENMGSIAATGDVLGSSSPDLIIGDSGYTFQDRDRGGALWVVAGPVPPGRHDLTDSYDLRIVGAGPNDNFGASIEVAAMHGPSAPLDLIVGAPQEHSSQGDQVGAVEIWSGRLTPPENRTIDLRTASSSTRILGVDAGDQTGSSLATGDFNGDGLMDLAIAASSADAAGNVRDGSGELTLVIGRRSMPPLVELKNRLYALWVHGAAPRDLLGAHRNNLAMADLDGDGRADLCVGSYRGGTDREGRVDCFRGE